MKRYLILVWIVSFASYSQNNSDEVLKIKQKVQIIDTDSRGVIFLENFFNEGITNVILKQVDKQDFELIKSSCNEDNYPECFKDAIDFSITDESENKLFSTLKVYRIAKFDNICNGQNFGEESILVVPAAENKNIANNCNFETDFYIIIPTKDIKFL